MTRDRYTLPAILLHWAMAVLLLGLFWLGWTMVDLPKGEGRSAAYGLHKSLGLLALLLGVARLAWRLRHPAPEPAGSGPTVPLARAVHLGLYLFFLLAPLAGWLASAFTPYAVRFFAFELPRLAAPDPGLNALFKAMHLALVWTGATLIALHIAGALYHVFRGDGAWRRMWPGKVSRN